MVEAPGVDYQYIGLNLQDPILQDVRVRQAFVSCTNRPRMVASVSPDGNTVEFEFLDLSGSNQYGHMHRIAFTFIDENHHIEEWTYMMPGDKPARGRFELQRTNFESGPAGL